MNSINTTNAINATNATNTTNTINTINTINSTNPSNANAREVIEKLVGRNPFGVLDRRLGFEPLAVQCLSGSNELDIPSERLVC